MIRYRATAHGPTTRAAGARKLARPRGRKAGAHPPLVILPARERKERGRASEVSMTVEQLIEELKQMPLTAVVFVEALGDDIDYVNEQIDEVVYDHGQVALRFTRED